MPNKLQCRLQPKYLVELRYFIPASWFKGETNIVLAFLKCIDNLLSTN